MSPISQIAVIAYALTILACAKAAFAARTCGRGNRAMRSWLCIAGLIALLLLARLIGAEDTLRGSLRDLAHSMHSYDNRRIWQALIAVLIFAGLGLIGFIARRYWRRSPHSTGRRALRIAMAAAFCFLPLYLLRILSLHTIDVFLYFGPLHPNWLIEGLLLAVIGFHSWRYASHCQRNPATQARNTRNDRKPSE